MRKVEVESEKEFWLRMHLLLSAAEYGSESEERAEMGHRQTNTQHRHQMEQDLSTAHFQMASSNASAGH